MGVRRSLKSLRTNHQMIEHPTRMIRGFLLKITSLAKKLNKLTKIKRQGRKGKHLIQKYRNCRMKQRSESLSSTTSK